MSAEQIAKEHVSFDDIAAMVEQLAEQVRGEYDLLLAVTRGGLIPAGLLAYRLGLRNILVAAVEFYDDAGQPGASPTFLQFPADPLLRDQRVLVVDEVWDSGTTVEAVTTRVRQAGGEPTVAVLHYKPTHSRVSIEPDYYVRATDAWVVYPWSSFEAAATR
jgi:hypoxanthine phosphoribosyltransferase